MFPNSSRSAVYNEYASIRARNNAQQIRRLSRDQLFKLRDAAQIMESQGITLEEGLCSYHLNQLAINRG